MTAWIIISAVVLPLILSEFSDISPWLARRLLTWGAGKLGDPGMCKRYREEWQAGLNDVPGNLIKLVKALSILCYTVPLLNWRIKSSAYLWPARKAADTFLAILHPSLCRRLREKRFYRYEMRIGKLGDASNPDHSITASKLIQLMDDVVKTSSRRSVLPRSSSIAWESYTLELDHRRRHLVIHGLRPAPRAATSEPTSHRSDHNGPPLRPGSA
jgi:hypothetical protein